MASLYKGLTDDLKIVLGKDTGSFFSQKTQLFGRVAAGFRLAASVVITLFIVLMVFSKETVGVGFNRTGEKWKWSIVGLVIASFVVDLVSGAMRKSRI